MFKNNNKHKISELNDKINSLENKNNVLEGKLETSKEISELDDKVKALENRNDTLENQLENIKKENSDLRTKIESFEKSVGNLQNLMNSKVPVYRLYDPIAKDHFYSINQSESQNAQNGGCRFEGVAFYALPK